ncbi:hypothetical protein BS50DRAFT_618827 [Corynespora cassiicola Philippines]|uniref:Zn(2)-C6 fungal-type domain-containing protein n=1 Tax=Corynespora cassiicola Philippines TaxID=1448308 RepID=A0A2T2NWV6_CORCC|nr:hypothetical protein BS50DRAFT_618827 [Corynespora cassiicola Philippines]
MNRTTKPSTRSNSTPRRRALVSCDRCKLRRARCIRADPNTACADCQSSGSQCESKLPRKQRVYGSVETLSLRFRALESLVKGLFPDEDVQDTKTLFKIASSRQISMPAQDDYTQLPDEIFSHSEKPESHTTADSNSIPRLKYARTNSSGTSGNRLGERNTYTTHCAAFYFGPSSSFSIGPKVQSLVTRYYALPLGTSLIRYPISQSSHHLASIEDQAGSSKRQKRKVADTAFGNRNASDDERKAHKKSRLDLLISDRVNASNTPKDFLPSKPVADSLVSAFFGRVNARFPIFDRDVFQSRYDATFSLSSTNLNFQDMDIGWTCCLKLIMVLGAQDANDRDEEKSLIFQKNCLEFVWANFARLMNVSIINIQALMLLAYWDHKFGSRNSSWILVGIANRMAFSLGLHRECTMADLEPEERVTRRIVWRAVYGFEKFLCIILGRPSSIDDQDTTTKYTDEDMVKNEETPVTYLEATIQLIGLSDSLRRKAYASDSSEDRNTPSIHVAKDLLEQQDNLYKSLPTSFLQSASTEANSSGNWTLHMFYHYLRCVITRSFLLQILEMRMAELESKFVAAPGNLHQRESLAQECVSSAQICLQILSGANEAGVLDGAKWEDDSYISHAILILCIDILIRPRRDTDSSQDTKRKKLVSHAVSWLKGSNLAPNLNQLSQAAVQLAGITGATNEPYTRQQNSGQFDLLAPLSRQNSYAGDEDSTGESGFMNASGWYENEFADISYLFDIQDPSFFEQVSDPTIHQDLGAWMGESQEH